MTCETVHSDQVVERYLLDRLSAADRESFEEHYYACDSCFEGVRLLQEIQVAAAGRRVVRMPGATWMTWGAAAAVLAAGLGLATMWRPHHIASERVATENKPLELLARVEAPRYTPSNLRGASGDAAERFRAAMAQYTRGEYAAAAAGLRGIESAAARFYLSVCDLLTDRIDEAVTQLRSVEGMGDTPYLEEARFFLAKALLAKKDAVGAARALEQTVALAGDREAEARRLLEQLRALPPVR